MFLATFVVTRPSLYSSFIIFHTFHKRNTPYGSWTQRDGRLHDTNIERTICRFSKPGIFALAAAVPVRIIYLFCLFVFDFHQKEVFCDEFNDNVLVCPNIYLNI